MKRSPLLPNLIVSALALMLTVNTAHAQVDGALKKSVESALATNPDVSAKLNAYKASNDAISVARAGWLPRVDLFAGVGRENDRIKTRNPQSDTVNRQGIGLSLTQVLWDGLGTKNEVSRTGHERLARYFELIDTTEQTALEAARAHYDVLRFRRLVQLAEDNYVQHKYAALQIQSRFKAGVGRGVDVEQANARLALAESNLSTEQANLHDVVARYQRVVGDAPPSGAPLATPLKQAMPASANEAVGLAVNRSAAVSAGVESMRAARAAVSARESVYQPRLEARLRGEGGKNLEGIREQSRNTTAELVLNWNLFNGGADQARVRQQVNALSQAADLRDKACRDVRQTAAIAYNDTRKLTEQLAYLDRNTLSIEKARDAYRQQFDIGQRSLLDLLNAENELYTAKRSYANAEYDLGISYARAHAAMNQLLAQLGLAQPSPKEPAADNWAADKDAPGRCPTTALPQAVTARADLDARAERIVASVPAAPAPKAVEPKK
jgi:outer membrane protein, adhesin transport system